MASELEIKEAVRARDGYKCRDCGMTNEEHQREYSGKSLHVHRLIPGEPYSVDWCVTLCYPCHGKKPKSVEKAFWMESEECGVEFFIFNLYDPADKRLLSLLEEESSRLGTDWGQLLTKIAIKRFDSKPVDYVI